MIIPRIEERDDIHRIIFEELCQGIVQTKSREIYMRVIEQMIHDGAEGIVLGCTELTLLLRQQDVAVPLYDTATLHANRAVEMAFS